MKSTVTIRAAPNASDLQRISAVARQTVLDIAKMDGALGHDAVALLYVERIYAAVVAGAIKRGA